MKNLQIFPKEINVTKMITKTKEKNLSERIDYMENQINTSTTNKI